ncbi:hypothetical protein [Bacillus sp. AFS040349]|uniref:hypothetical protein n=1 Tax=Bacillus sp. AFS040349 TaxID=2033502 RepID=UPI000BFBFF0B|nr:hypothetical protein [Bacillus sp. AFS040349]PGT82208.1 hypothetical protein COD11_15545 [Bacillus sp. AFS040349]
MKNLEETYEIPIALENLIIASLLSQGEIDLLKSNELIVPFSKEKAFFLSSYLKQHNILDFVHVQIHKEQFKIHSNNRLKELIDNWFNSGTKTFIQKLDSNILRYEAIILCINLFGSRKLESISIQTTVNKKYLRTVTYCIEQVLKVPVIPGKNQIKIPDVLELIIKSIDHLDTINSTELTTYLNSMEKNRLINNA